jgi:hypothetical protein
VRSDWAPSIEHLERDAEALQRAAERLLELARDQHRRIQDYDAELEADAEGTFAGSLQVGRHNAAHQLRWIARAMTRSCALLVPPGSENYVAARQVIGWLDDGQDADAPWRSLEQVEPAEAA